MFFSTPVIPNLPYRKQREIPASIRLRYTCLTCGKLYIGRIEKHYRKFPDHRRQPLSSSSLSDVKPHSSSYSTIKMLSESGSSKSHSDADPNKSEMNKSVLSPTPGTQASETNGEPSLPMETLTTQSSPHTDNHPSPQIQQISQFPQVDEFFGPKDTSSPVKRGRGRGRRGRGGGRGRGARVTTTRKAPAPKPKPKEPLPPAVKPTAMLERVRYSTTYSYCLLITLITDLSIFFNSFFLFLILL